MTAPAFQGTPPRDPWERLFQRSLPADAAMRRGRE